MGITVSGPQPTADTQVNLPVGQVTVAGYSPRLIYHGIIVTGYPVTISTGGLIQGGKGAAGFITIKYPTITSLGSAYAGYSGSDAAGNQFSVGYMGPVFVQRPGVSPIVVETWHQASLSNASNSGNGVNGLFYRLTTENELELIWDFNATVAGGAVVFTLPQLYRPVTQQNIRTGWYGTGPTSYSTTFIPHLEILGQHDKQPGALSVNSLGGITTTTVFGHAFIPMDVT